MATNTTQMMQVDVARLQERMDANKQSIEDFQEQVSELNGDFKLVKETQNQTLVVLQKMESALEHMNERFEKNDEAENKLISEVEYLKVAHTEVSTKFKLVLGMLTVIGTALVGVAVKLMFFSPVLNGG